jgi:hypothetical protein
MCLSVGMYDFMCVCVCDLLHDLISEISNTYVLESRDGAMILCIDF